ncbi:MAG: hypothetical protein ACJ77L_00730, partial [Solirubrobacteraceae bacterium]
DAVVSVDPLVDAVVSVEPLVDAVVSVEPLVDAVVSVEPVLVSVEPLVDALVSVEPLVDAVVSVEPVLVSVDAVVSTEPLVELLVPLVVLVSTEALVELVVPLEVPTSTEVLVEPLVSTEAVVPVGTELVSRAWAIPGRTPNRPAAATTAKHRTIHRRRGVLLQNTRSANVLSGSCTHRPPRTGQGQASCLSLSRRLPPSGEPKLARPALVRTGTPKKHSADCPSPRLRRRVGRPLTNLQSTFGNEVNRLSDGVKTHHQIAPAGGTSRRMIADFRGGRTC